MPNDCKFTVSYNNIYRKKIAIIIRRRKNKDKAEFHFQPISTESFKKIIIGLDCNKSNLNGFIPTNVLKGTCDDFITYITEIINQSVTHILQ